MIDKLILFTDGSTNGKIGYGAYLIVLENELSMRPNESKVKVKQFEETSSTKIELQILLFALAEIKDLAMKVIVYTDSQNIVELPARRARLEQNDFCSGKGRLLNNHELYRQFYEVLDELDCEFIKVKGHQPSRHKDEIDRLFTLVDLAARKAMRDAIPKRKSI